MQTVKTVVVFAGTLLAVACAGFIHVQNQPKPTGPPVVVSEDRPSHPAHLGIPLGHLPPTNRPESASGASSTIGGLGDAES